MLIFLLVTKHTITCSAKATTVKEELKSKCGVQHEAWQAWDRWRGGERKYMCDGAAVFSGRSDNLLDAGSLEAASTALLLDLTG